MMIRTIEIEQTIWRLDSLQNLSDAELVERAQTSRDNLASGHQAVHELYDRYNKAIFRYLWARVSDRQLAEDLTGEVFARMVAGLPRYRSNGGTFQAWIYRIAHNLLIDQYRKDRSKNEISLENAEYLGPHEDGPEHVTEQGLFIEKVRVGIQKLDAVQQEILVLRFINDLSLQEVAAALGKSVGAVKIAQHRALKELRGILNMEESEVKDG
jgi:RNA polymerase sigma-70 factor (ECF subfamily)